MLRSSKSNIIRFVDPAHVSVLFKPAWESLCHALLLSKPTLIFSREKEKPEMKPSLVLVLAFALVVQGVPMPYVCSPQSRFNPTHVSHCHINCFVMHSLDVSFHSLH